ncbi:hypothetical protein J3R83DRAFT_5232 [Lanmaoa asiatica]|nr:hypothetical protein J3R83DRAFT_5232 [Lanmaoa asiatica]
MFQFTLTHDDYIAASINYIEDISHWASSSSQIAACSFEPGTPEDIGVADDTSSCRFSEKHELHLRSRVVATPPIQGFRRPAGVQIAMSRFSQVDYDSTAQTATIGAGLIWDDVYAALEPHGVNVVGGRVTGVGVAGFTLGGGYSWLTNQYGLTIDTVRSYELVAPNGTVMNVTETSSPDLFFALKVCTCFSKHDVVTTLLFHVLTQDVKGGVITYTADVLDKVNLATADFSANNTDPKAAIITTYNYLLGEPGVSEILFYDAPTPPAGIFDEFLAIPSFTRDISNALLLFFGTVFTCKHNLRNTSIVNESIYWGEHLPDSEFFVSYDVEPFLSTLFTHNTTPSAYPPDRTQGFLPLNIYFAWLSSESDQAIYDAIRTSAMTLQAHVIDSGQSDAAPAAIYPNYAIFDTPLVQLVLAIKAVVDPDKVMDLAGGFKF